MDGNRPLPDDVDEPPGMDRLWQNNGRAMALADLGFTDSEQSDKVANQGARRWESDGQGQRFTLWISASDDNSLKVAYQSAIRQITFSASSQPLGNHRDITVQGMADSFMAFLAKKREMALRPHQFAVVVSNPSPPLQFFHKKFFSASSNWWNSWGRFLVTVTQLPVHVEVQMDENAPVSLRILPSAVCRNIFGQPESFDAI